MRPDLLLKIKCLKGRYVIYVNQLMLSRGVEPPAGVKIHYTHGSFVTDLISVPFCYIAVCWLAGQSVNSSEFICLGLIYIVSGKLEIFFEYRITRIVKH